MNYIEFKEILGLPDSYLRRLTIRSNKLYKSFYLDQKNKKRKIDAPNLELKGIQNIILKNILETIPLSNAAQGFIRKRSIKTNALHHLNNKYVLCMDIENFFPSIKQSSIYKIFVEYTSDTNFARILTGLCSYKGYLPQGAITSPYISNLFLTEFDKIISSECQKIRVAYTRYADDMTFSSNNRDRLKDMPLLISKELEKLNLKIKKKKTRFMSGKGPQIVTGLRINNGLLSIGRKKKKLLRAQIHNIIKNKSTENVNFTKGMLNFLKDIEPHSFEKFKSYYTKLVKNHPGA